MKKIFLPFALCAVLFFSCKKKDSPVKEEEKPVIEEPVIEESAISEDVASFKMISSVDLGGEGSAEISAYDPISKRLFVVNNEAASKVEVIDLSNFPEVTKLQSIDFSTTSGGANSVAVYGGKLAVALEATTKQDNGHIAVLDCQSLQQLKIVEVGALPDMVTFSPDGNFIVSANEGEPSENYSIDPLGSVSIIEVSKDYAVTTLDFASFEGQKADLMSKGLRVYGLNASLAQDIEPEYVYVSADSKKAWVTLQENNGMAEVDLTAKAITKVIPLGTKDISLPENAMDLSDRDDQQVLRNWPVKAFFLPDAISGFVYENQNYVVLANEGDTREYDAYDEEERVKKLTLDPAKFPNAAELKNDGQLGRLVTSLANGDTDNDGDYDEIYTLGGRSVSVRKPDGTLVAEIGKDMEQRVIDFGKYDDERSDSKGIEVEAVTVATVSGKTLAFIGSERADVVLIYDISTPSAPKFVQIFETGDAPEGLLYIKPKDSPNGRSILVTSSEGDGVVNFFQPNQL